MLLLRRCAPSVCACPVPRLTTRRSRSCLRSHCPLPLKGQPAPREPARHMPQRAGLYGAHLYRVAILLSNIRLFSTLISGHCVHYIAHDHMIMTHPLAHKNKIVCPGRCAVESTAAGRLLPAPCTTSGRRWCAPLPISRCGRGPTAVATSWKLQPCRPPCG